MLASNKAASTIISGIQSANDRDSSYSISRYLADQSYTPGHRPARSAAEVEESMLVELQNFDAKFNSCGDPPHGN